MNKIQSNYPEKMLFIKIRALLLLIASIIFGLSCASHTRVFVSNPKIVTTYEWGYSGATERKRELIEQMFDKKDIDYTSNSTTLMAMADKFQGSGVSSDFISANVAASIRADFLNNIARSGNAAADSSNPTSSSIVSGDINNSSIAYLDQTSTATARHPLLDALKDAEVANFLKLTLFDSKDAFDDFGDPPIDRLDNMDDLFARLVLSTKKIPDARLKERRDSIPAWREITLIFNVGVEHFGRVSSNYMASINLEINKGDKCTSNVQILSISPKRTYERKKRTLAEIDEISNVLNFAGRGMFQGVPIAGNLIRENYQMTKEINNWIERYPRIAGFIDGSNTKCANPSFGWSFYPTNVNATRRSFFLRYIFGFIVPIKAYKLNSKIDPGSYQCMVTLLVPSDCKSIDLSGESFSGNVNFGKLKSTGNYQQKFELPIDVKEELVDAKDTYSLNTAKQLLELFTKNLKEMESKNDALKSQKNTKSKLVAKTEKEIKDLNTIIDSMAINSTQTLDAAKKVRLNKIDLRDKEADPAKRKQLDDEIKDLDKKIDTYVSKRLELDTKNRELTSLKDDVLALEAILTELSKNIEIEKEVIGKIEKVIASLKMNSSADTGAGFSNN